jgi:hypothetical protein
MANLYGPRILTDGLVLHLDAGNRKSYPLSGNTIYDLSGNGNNGTFGASTAAPTFSTDNGGCLSFDGSNDYITVPSVNSKTNFDIGDDYTISFWVNVNSTQAVANARSIIEKWEQSGPYPYVFRYLTNETLNTNIYNGTTGNPSNSTSSIADRWVNCCYVVKWSANNSKLYVNATQEDSDTLTLTGTISTSSPVYIGKRGGPNPYNCNMKFASLNIYNKALSANEVQQNYNALKGRFGL